MGPIFYEIMHHAGSRNGLSIVQHLIGGHAEAAKIFRRIAALIFQNTFVGNCVKRHSRAGRNGDYGFGSVVRQVSPSD